MIKKVIFMALLILIIVGAVYSYNKVAFGQKTAMLFRVVFGGDEGMSRHPQGGAPPNMPNFRPDMPHSGESRQHKPDFRPDMQQGAKPWFGPPGEMRGRKQPPSGKIISMRNVIPYAFILAFFVIITRFAELIIRKEFRSKFSDFIFPML